MVQTAPLTEPDDRCAVEAVLIWVKLELVCRPGTFSKCLPLLKAKTKVPNNNACCFFKPLIWESGNTPRQCTAKLEAEFGDYVKSCKNVTCGEFYTASYRAGQRYETLWTAQLEVRKMRNVAVAQVSTRPTPPQPAAGEPRDTTLESRPHFGTSRNRATRCSACDRASEIHGPARAGIGPQSEIRHSRRSRPHCRSKDLRSCRDQRDAHRRL